MMGHDGYGRNSNERYIGVFDSGVGGISVLKRLVSLMPHERFVFYGDSANAPRTATRPRNGCSTGRGSSWKA